MVAQALRLALAVVAVLLTSATWAGPTLTLTEHDFQNNIEATDRITYHAAVAGHSGVYGSDETVPNDEDHNLAVVYTKGSSVTVVLTFHNNEPYTVYSGTLYVDSASFVEDALSIQVMGGYTPASHTMTAASASLAIPAGGNGTCSVTLTDLPNHVSKGHITFDAHVEGNFGAQTPGGPMVAWSGGGSLNQTFVTYSAPTASQEVPWVDVLGFTSAWAMGSDTEAEVVENTTLGLYYGGIFAYNLGEKYVPNNYFYVLTDGNNEERLTYRLKQLLEAKAARIFGLTFTPATGMVGGNCFDINGFLDIGITSLGVSGSMLATQVEAGNGYVTNPFCPIGSDSSQSGLYLQTMFTSHCQFIRGGPLVSDAALGYLNDLSDYTWMNPAYDWDGSTNGHLRASFQSFPNGTSRPPTGQCFRQYEPDYDVWTSHSDHPFNVLIPDPTIPPDWYHDASDFSIDYNYHFVIVED